MKKSKIGKKGKQKSKRKGSLSSDDEQAPVSTSLPPAVNGQLRCFLTVSVSNLTWTVEKHPTDVQLRMYWWGEQGQGTLLCPLGQDGKKGVTSTTKWSLVRYPVCSGPKQFAAYLNDMGTLLLEAVHTSTQIPFGKALISEITRLTASQPVNVVVPIMSVISPFNKLADIQVYIKFESVSAAYNKLSSSIPTVDIGLDKENVDISNPQPIPPPYLNPATPVSHPRQHKHAKDPFESPAQVKGVKFSEDPPEKMEYTLEPSLLSLLANEYTSPKRIDAEFSQPLHDSPSVYTGKAGDPHEASSQHVLPTTTSEEHPSVAASVDNHTGVSPHDQSTDWITALLDRGQRLREGLAMSTLLDDNVSESLIEKYSSPDRHVLPGSMLKDMLHKGKRSHDPNINYDLLHKIPSPERITDDHGDDKMIDLLMGEQHDYMDNISIMSDISQELSEIGDPLHDESLLMDLFYKSQLDKTTSNDPGDTISTEEDLDSTIDETLQEHEQTPAHSKKKKKETYNLKKEKKHKRKDVEDETSIEQPSETSEDSTTQKSSELIISSPNQKVPYNDGTAAFPIKPTSNSGLVEQLGADTLTTLGRVNTARVIIDKLELTDAQIQTGDKKPSTFFVEYYFPIASPKDTKSIVRTTEVTRVASKKIQDKAVMFNHRSVFPISFNATVLEQWSKTAMMLKIFKRDSGQRQPVELGAGFFPLKPLLVSSNLSHMSTIEVKEQPSSAGFDETMSSRSTLSSQGYLPSDSSSTSHGIVGNLEVTIELGVDGRPVHVTPVTTTQPTIPIPSTTSVTMVSRPVVISCPQPQHQRDVPLSSKPPLPHTLRSPGEVKHQSPVLEPSDILTLHSLLWIQEGKGITLEPHGSHGNHIPGISGRANLFLVSRMFWCEEVSKSSVCWGSSNPQFGFRQVAPVLLTPTLLHRTCNNFMVIEVWNKVIPHGEQLIGIVKLPLHQLYLSYRDPKITKTLVKSKFPVICFDGVLPVTNPFTTASHGELKVLLAMGTEEQISSLLAIKDGNIGGDGVVDQMPSATNDHRPMHHLDVQKRESQLDTKTGPLPQGHNTIDHQFEITVGDVRGLSVFKSTVWGETDCYVQYHFPHQHQNKADITFDTEVVPGLKSHQTPTTLCVPDPSFQDVTRHSFILPSGIPVQRYLLAAYSGSWTSMSSLPGSGGIPFELWRRYYYPNVRDQLVAKASLPVAKLCAMVTMQRHREPSVQSYSLPLVVLPDDQGSKQDTGLLEITVKYQAKRVQHVENMKTTNDQVNLSIDVIRACGLKDAAMFHVQSNTIMSYPADVGVNAYVIIKLPLGRKKSQFTRTVARTFAPDFFHHIDITVPLQMTGNKSHGVYGGGGLVSLAEKLEMTEAVFEIWHQHSRGLGNVGSHSDGHRKHDILLGVITIPMSELLISRTGIRGWHAIKPPNIDDSIDHTTTLGGLQVSIKFEDHGDRDSVIHTGRSLGWSPPPGIEYDDSENQWIESEDEDEDGESPKGLELSVRINRAWIPESVIQVYQAQHSNMKEVKGYVRYKLYDKSPLCSRVVAIRPTNKDTGILEVKHNKSLLVPATSSFVWYLREESLEAQVWLKGKTRKDNSGTLPGQRDKLVGSAFVDLSSLVVPGLKHSQISGVFPLFKAGADAMDGARIHVQISLSKPSSRLHHGHMDEQDALDDTVSSDEYPSTKGYVDDHGTSTKSSSDHHQDESLDNVPQTPAKSTPSTIPDDSFAAHVIIQEACNLPTIPDNSGERLCPNVFVSYQTSPSSQTVCTPVIKSSRKPVWQYQKLEHLPLSILKTQNLVFKVWHRSECLKDNDTTGKIPTRKTKRDDKSGSSPGDCSLGFASVDLAPLAAGLRQIDGWYNIMDFNGQCKGQIKVGIVPLAPVSPSRCLTKSRLLLSSPVSSRDEPRMTVKFSGYGNDPVTMTTQPVTVPSEPEQNIPYSSSGIFTNQADDTLEIPVLPTSTTSSFLLRQLRQNMQDLDKLQKGLQAKLTPSPENRRRNDMHHKVRGDPSQGRHVSQKGTDYSTTRTQKSVAVQSDKDWPADNSSDSHQKFADSKDDFSRTDNSADDHMLVNYLQTGISGKLQGSFSEPLEKDPTDLQKEYPYEHSHDIPQSSIKEMYVPKTFGADSDMNFVPDKHWDEDEYERTNDARNLAAVSEKANMVDINAERQDFRHEQQHYDSNIDKVDEGEHLHESDCDDDTLEEVSLFDNGKSPFPYVQDIDSWLSSGDDEEAKTQVTSLPFTLPDDNHNHQTQTHCHDTNLNSQPRTANPEEQEHHDKEHDAETHLQEMTHSNTEHEAQAKEYNSIEGNYTQKPTSQFNNQVQTCKINLDQDKKESTETRHIYSEKHKDVLRDKTHLAVDSDADENPEMCESEIQEAINLFSKKTEKHEMDRDFHSDEENMADSLSISGDFSPKPDNGNDKENKPESTLPNFFMTAHELENSMRALRLGAKLGYPHSLTNNLPKSKLLERTYKSTDDSGNEAGEIFSQYSRKKVLYKAKEDLQPPLTSIEIDRIARIFSSKS